MTPQKPFYRFLIGAACVLIVLIIGFAWFGAMIPTWGSVPEDVARVLPADELVPNPSLTWNHTLTIHAPAAQVYPWLAQIGDSRAAFYSITFIENAACALSGECKYVNANQVHPEWQTPQKGAQGIIMDFMAIQDYQPGQYVLATATEKLPMKWTWLWYLRPVDANTTQLIVRHRIAFPAEAPQGLINTVFASGFVMERGMMLGIQARAEGALPGPADELLGALCWLLVFGMGLACAVRFVRVGDGYITLGVGLAALVVLFVLTYIQPPLALRLGLALVVAVGVAAAFVRQQFRQLYASRLKPA